LLSEHETANGGAFVLGWICAISGLASAALIAQVSFEPSHSPAALRYAELAIGLILLGGAVLAWSRRSHTAADRRPSRWLSATDSISQSGAAILAVALALLNVKDSTLSVGAGAAISDARLTAGQSILTLAAFAAIASVTVAAPFLFAVVAGQRAEPTLRRWHGWLDRHGTAVGAGVISLTGVYLVAAGLG
jgi:cytochrome c biogenesis protein CcdA